MAPDVIRALAISGSILIGVVILIVIISFVTVRSCIDRKPDPSVRMFQMRSTSCQVPSWQNIKRDGSVGENWR